MHLERLQSPLTHGGRAPIIGFRCNQTDGCEQTLRKMKNAIPGGLSVIRKFAGHCTSHVFGVIAREKAEERVPGLRVFGLNATGQMLSLRRMTAAKPSAPVPSSTRLEGSGVGLPLGLPPMPADVEAAEGPPQVSPPSMLANRLPL